MKSKFIQPNNIIFYFTIPINEKFPKTVTITGSWCNWEFEYPMEFNPFLNAFYLKI